MPMYNQNQYGAYGNYPQMAQMQPMQNVPYGAPMQQMPQMQSVQAGRMDPNVPTELRWVSSEVEAMVAQVQPGTCVMLMDSTPSSNKFWLKAVGVNGVPLPIREFTWTECTKQSQPQITYGDAAQSNQEVETLRKEVGSLKDDLAAIRKFMEDLK